MSYPQKYILDRMNDSTLVKEFISPNQTKKINDESSSRIKNVIKDMAL